MLPLKNVACKGLSFGKYQNHVMNDNTEFRQSRKQFLLLIALVRAYKDASEIPLLDRVSVSNFDRAEQRGRG